MQRTHGDPNNNRNVRTKGIDVNANEGGMGTIPPMGTPLQGPFRLVERVHTMELTCDERCNMDRAEKRKKQREYYRQHSDQLRAKAKVYRERWTEEQKQKKRERDLAYYHRTKSLIARRRRSQRQER